MQLPEKFRSFLLPGVFILLGVFLLTLGLIIYLRGYFSEEPVQIISNEQSELVPVDGKELVVEVSGAVVKPGVYRLDSGSRIDDALISAGGLRKDADKNFVFQKINRAAKLTDGQKLYIPEQGEQVVLSVQTNKSSGLVSINSASQSELEDLPGIGQVTAKKIIDGRPYGSVEELSSKKIVGEKAFAQIKDLVGL